MIGQTSLMNLKAQREMAFFENPLIGYANGNRQSDPGFTENIERKRVVLTGGVVALLGSRELILKSLSYNRQKITFPETKITKIKPSFEEINKEYHELVNQRFLRKLTNDEEERLIELKNQIENEIESDLGLELDVKIKKIESYINRLEKLEKRLLSK